jgi:hypothetical protein
LKANKVNLFVFSVLFVFWYHSPNVLDTLSICNISWLRVNNIDQSTLTSTNCVFNLDIPAKFCALIYYFIIAIFSAHLVHNINNCMICPLATGNWLFELFNERCCSYIQRWASPRKFVFFKISCLLSVDTSVNSNPATQLHIEKESLTYLHRCDNL